MRRTVIEPANVSGAALADLKDWLGISRPNEDDLLQALLLSSLDMCEAFTGRAPVSQMIEERLPLRAGRYRLASTPVQNVNSVQVIAENNTRSPLDQGSYDVAIDGDGCAVLTLSATPAGRGLSVELRVGIAPDWSSIPAALKLGIIRLAAHLYRDRDRPAQTKKELAPPASVTALWRPWRQMRLT